MAWERSSSRIRILPRRCPGRRAPRRSGTGRHWPGPRPDGSSDDIRQVSERLVELRERASSSPVSLRMSSPGRSGRRPADLRCPGSIRCSKPLQVFLEAPSSASSKSLVLERGHRPPISRRLHLRALGIFWIKASKPLIAFSKAVFRSGSGSHFPRLGRENLRDQGVAGDLDFRGAGGETMRLSVATARSYCPSLHTG